MDCGTLSHVSWQAANFRPCKGSLQAHLLIRPAISNSQMAAPCSLDEVANLSYEIQASLLRVLQEKKFKRVGGTKETDIDVAHYRCFQRKPAGCISKRKIQEDLYHRLNEFMINLPPLRERKMISRYLPIFPAKTNAELGKDIRASTTTYWMPLSITPGPVTTGVPECNRRATLLTPGSNISLKSPAEIAMPNPGIRTSSIESR